MPAHKEIGFWQFYTHLGKPLATPDEIDAWNTIDKDNSFEGDIKVGLFGYDISSIAQACRLIDQKDEGYYKVYFGYCPFIEARGLDGLAFGVYWKIPDNDDGWYFCAGFRNDEPGNRNGNTMACADDEEDMETYYFYDNYQVKSGEIAQFNGNFDYDYLYMEYDEDNAQGLGEWAFRSLYLGYGAEDGEYHLQAFRFIGQAENNHQRWSVGDEINMFFVDMNAETYKDNAGFVLEGATQLAVSGAALLASVYLM